jgi:hypothetical protein
LILCPLQGHKNGIASLKISQNHCFSWKNSLFSREKQFVFNGKTTCFQRKNNLFSARKQNENNTSQWHSTPLTPTCLMVAHGCDSLQNVIQSKKGKSY